MNVRWWYRTREPNNAEDLLSGGFVYNVPVCSGILRPNRRPRNGRKRGFPVCSAKKVVEGEHETVRVSGIYGPSLDHTVIEDAECPSDSTWVELALSSQKNKEKLRKMLDNSRRAYVVLEGEFYGPPCT
jgi:hypothetical protein